MQELLELDATAQAELVRRREVKASELVDAAIARIEEVNPALNAVVTPVFDSAREAAARPAGDGPFAGVPFLLKDHGTPCAGVRLTSSSAYLRDYISPEDSDLVARYKGMGFLILGKTNTPEFGLTATTEPHLFGPTHNPWDVTRSPGGSSGGSAAAVASAMVAAAHGNDGGGSIRIPAAWCGVFGLKPTRGRNPKAIDPAGLGVDHVLTRSVRDSAAILDGTAGALPGDPYHLPAPPRPFAEEVRAKSRRLRIGFSAEPPPGTSLHPDCAGAVKDAAALCAALGHEVEEAAPTQNHELFRAAFTMMWEAGAAATIDGFAMMTGRAPTEDLFEPLTWSLAQRGRQHTAPALLMAKSMFQMTARTMADFHQKYDVWLTPTLGEVPLPLGELDSSREDPRRGFERVLQFVTFTPYQNATGQPAMSVPLHWNEQGLPVGVQFVGRFADEATLFSLAAQLEEARPWANRRPSGFGCSAVGAASQKRV